MALGDREREAFFYSGQGDTHSAFFFSFTHLLDSKTTLTQRAFPTTPTTFHHSSTPISGPFASVSTVLSCLLTLIFYRSAILFEFAVYFCDLSLVHLLSFSFEKTRAILLMAPVICFYLSMHIFLNYCFSLYMLSPLIFTQKHGLYFFYLYLP